MKPAANRPLVPVTSAQRALLQRWARARTAPQRVVLRSAIVLLASEGTSIAAIARQLGTSRSTVRLWCQRFSAGGPASLVRDAPGRGRKPKVTPDELARVLASHGGPRLSIRQLARRFGTSASAVHRALVVQRQFRNTGEPG